MSAELASNIRAIATSTALARFVVYLRHGRTVLTQRAVIAEAGPHQARSVRGMYVF